MFKSRLAKTIGRVDGFIADLQSGIDKNAQKVGDMDKAIAKRESAFTKILNKLHEVHAKAINKMEQDQEAVYKELKAGEKLLTNLTKLKG